MKALAIENARQLLIMIVISLPFFCSISRASEMEWRSLFNGENTEGWRQYRGGQSIQGWEVIDGALTRTGPGGDIITIEVFQDFELSLEWLVEPGGNSGVFFRANEEHDYIFVNAPEMQVLDDANHRDGKDPLTSAGSNYGLHAAPRGIVRPAREWNHARIVVQGKDVSHYLNDKLVVDYTLGSDDWLERVANSKFADWKSYGKLSEGHIGLQDHGDQVAFKNIRIREL